MEQIDAILVWIVMIYFTQGMPRNAVWLIFTMAESIGWANHRTNTFDMTTEILIGGSDKTFSEI